MTTTTTTTMMMLMKMIEKFTNVDNNQRNIAQKVIY